MAATLLDMTNALRDLLREERLTSVAIVAPDVKVQVGLLNRAARQLFARRPWSFLHRDDGYLFLPARVEATAIPTALSTFLLTGFSNDDLLRFSDGALATKIVLTDEPTYPNTSYRVVDLQGGFGISATIPLTYTGASGSFSAIVYAQDAALPPTVAQILSIRNEEGVPIRFETIDTFDDFDRAVPWDAERFGVAPEFVAVGGQVVPTMRSSAAVTPGLGVRVFPAPDANVLLRYTYVRRVADLVADGDLFAGVPPEISDLVVQFAFEAALMGNIEDDPQRGGTLHAQNELRFRELAASDRRDVGRRIVPQPFSSHRRSPEWRIPQIPEP